MKRFWDWEQQLGKFLEFAASRPRQWGINDCGMFTADAIYAITGVDPVKELRGTYSSEKESLRAMHRWLKAKGCPAPTDRNALMRDVATTLARQYGLRMVKGGLAQRGDVVLLDISDFETGWDRALGIVGLRGQPVTAGALGTVELTTWHIVTAWHVE